MATIILARHGKLQHPSWKPIPGSALAEWRETGATAPLDPVSQPSLELRQLADAVPVLVASPLRRSLDSACVLWPGKPPLVEPLIREVESRASFATSLLLPAKLWSVAARVAWYTGSAPGAESYPAARERARVAVVRLATLAGEQDRVLVIGHGIMNGLIGARLLRTGWQGPRLRQHRHWGFAIYRREAKPAKQ